MKRYITRLGGKMKHLDEVNVTYWQHLRFAFRIGFVMILAGILTMIHAVFPNFMPTVATDFARHLNEILNERDDDGTSD